MLIAIDYDETYTRDPGTWNSVILLLKRLGHRVVCVTSRSNTHDNRTALGNILPLDIHVIFCNYNAKAEMTRKAGYHVDIWIDDNPYTIDPDGKYTSEETKQRFNEWKEKDNQ